MRILTDCAAELRGLAGSARWVSEAVAGLSSSERALWRALGGAPELMSTGVAHGEGDDFWTLAAALREAPRSQYDALLEALDAGLSLPGPTACVALTGRGFHGQHGRAWQCEAGNLFLSVALAPRLPVDRLVPALTMLPAVAVVDAIAAVGGPRVAPGIKWVNDVLIEGRKVAGVLTATNVRADLVESAVLGIGVNIARAPELGSSAFVGRAGCLRDAGIVVELGAFARHVLASLANRYRELLDEGHAPLLEAYRTRSVVLGQRVRLCDEASPDAAPELVGVVCSIEPDLSLRLDGHPALVHRGRLLLDPPYPTTGGNS